MTKYILVYKSNQATDWSTLPEAEIKQIMHAWGEWVGSLGTSRKDSGAVKFGGKTATKHGIQNSDNLTTGYAIIEAENFDEALEIAQRAPNVTADTGTIEVYEAFAVQM